MKSVTRKIDVSASQIQERVALLAQQFSQSDLSRRTHTPISNVNRYVNGARVPADFCGALVQGLGVNPAWLLTGEGAPYLSDVTAGTHAMAGDMLELVEALNAVSRMRLGSLTGKHHLRVLRELNDALRTYQELREKLNARSGPILRQICDDMRRHSDRQEFEIVSDLRKAGKQIADFCQDREQLRRFHAAEATHEFATGQPENALNISRDVFARTLTGSDRLDANSIIQAHNLVASLCQNYLFKEARRVSRAVIELAAEQLDGLEAGYELKTLAGIVEVEAGNLAGGLGLIDTSFPRTSERYRTHSVGPVMRAHLLSGFMTFEDAKAKGGRILGKGRHLLRFAIWLEDATRLEAVLSEYVGSSADALSDTWLECTHARHLAVQLRRKGQAKLPAALKDLESANASPLPREIAGVVQAVYATQLAIAAGDERVAAKRLAEADAQVAGLAPEQSLDMLTRALHARNTLRVPGAPGVLAAREFLAAMLRAGYSVFSGA